MGGKGSSLNGRFADRDVKYQSVFKHSFDAILLTTPDGRILAANPAACRMFGRSEEEMCRLGRDAIMNINDQRFARAARQLEKTGEFAGELTGLGNDGTLLHLDVASSVFTDTSGEKRISMIIRDISYSEAFLGRLLENEANMRSVLENTDNYIWSVDGNLKFREGNSVFRARFMMETGRQINPGDDFLEQLPDDLMETWKRYLMRGLSGTSFTTMRSSGTRSDKVYSRFSFNPVRNLAGEVTGVAIVGTDVTDLMMMQKGLVRTGVMLKEAQSVAKVGNWEYDIRLNKPDWSDELQRIFGLNQAAGEHSWEGHLDRIDPDDLPRFREAVIAAHAEGIPFAMVLRLQIPGEDVKWVNVICKTEKDDDGKMSRIYGTVQDITLQKKAERELAISEERYRNLFEKSVVPMMVEDFSEVRRYFDQLGRRGVRDFRRYFTKYPERATQCVSMVKIRDVNRTSIRFFGVKQKSDLITNLDIFFAEGSYKTFTEEIITLAEGKKEFECDMPVKMPGGQERIIQLRLHVMPDDQDTLSQVLVSWIDVTDRLKYQEGLKKSGDTLRMLNMHIEEARENERTRIAMNLHDDLGQQLTALRMNLSWLRKRIGVQSPLVTDKLDAVEHMIDGSIGTVQRISSDLRPALLYDLGLKEAVEWHMKQNLEPAGIKGSFSLEPEDLNFDIKTSIVLFRIIQEAITNIIRHSRAGRADVRISMFLSFIQLVIRDNGKGIDAGAADDPRSFGITSIKERVKNVSGHFRIIGEKEKGTMLIVRIPLS